jgi:hypothetical protein
MPYFVEQTCYIALCKHAGYGSNGNLQEIGCATIIQLIPDGRANKSWTFRKHYFIPFRNSYAPDVMLNNIQNVLQHSGLSYKEKIGHTKSVGMGCFCCPLRQPATTITSSPPANSQR